MDTIPDYNKNQVLVKTDYNIETNLNLPSLSATPINLFYGLTMKPAQIKIAPFKLITALLFSLFLTPVSAETTAEKNNETAIFAGGCFWCMEPPFDKLDGVISTTSGYTAGHKTNPTYAEVSAGGTGHTEAVEIIYDSSKISYSELLDVFWSNIDPVAVNRQFCDAGTQYRSGIYYLDKTQEKYARKSLKELEENKPFEGTIATEIIAASTFYPAEGYHQDYYQKNPVRYKFYRYRCGRDQRLEEIWDKK